MTELRLIVFAAALALATAQYQSFGGSDYDYAADFSFNGSSRPPVIASASLQDLLDFHDQYYLTADEVSYLTDKGDHVLLLRLTTSSFSTKSNANVTVKNSATYNSASSTMKTAIANAIPGLSSVATGPEVYSIEAAGYDMKSRLITVFTVFIYPKVNATQVNNLMSSAFITQGKLQPNINITRIIRQGFHRVAATTVYQALVRLTDLTYLPQFADLSNTATCAVTNQAYLLTRRMMRNRFGEFFDRTVVLGLFSGPYYGDTIVSLAFLLEADEYNGVGMEDVFNSQFQLGYFGTHPVTVNNYITAQLQYVPEDFYQYLVATVTRHDLVLDTTTSLKTVFAPCLSAILLVMIIIMLCAFEGWCCKTFIEDRYNCFCFKLKQDDFEVK